MKTHLLSLDPSVRSPGAALWEISDDPSTPSKLLAAGKVKVLIHPERKDGPPLWVSDAERWIYVAEQVISWMCQVAHLGQFEHDLRVTGLAFERPQIYRESKSRGDHNDLPPLAAIGTAVACLLGASGVRPRVHSPTPAEWSGQLPKSTTGDPWRTPRGRRIASRLREDEFNRIPAQHDSVDAVGIGLHALGRLGVRRAYPGVSP